MPQRSWIACVRRRGRRTARPASGWPRSVSSMCCGCANAGSARRGRPIPGMRSAPRWQPRWGSVRRWHQACWTMRAIRLRLPQVGAALLAGDISYAMFQTIVYRTTLITDSDAKAAVDAALALKVRRSAADKRPVGRICRHGGRARRSRCGAAPAEAHANREFSIWDGGQGLTGSSADCLPATRSWWMRA